MLTMFYCERCRGERGWPSAVPKSFGHCELCNEVGVVYDYPMRLLIEYEQDIRDFIQREAMDRLIRQGPMYGQG